MIWALLAEAPASQDGLVGHDKPLRSCGRACSQLSRWDLDSFSGRHSRPSGALGLTFCFGCMIFGLSTR